MASRVASKVRKGKAVVDTVCHSPFLKATIPAQQARAAPPLGPQLGKPDRTYDLKMTHPSSMHLLRLSAAVKKGAAEPGKQICGRLTMKHIYHIAEVKKEDPALYTLSLEQICRMLIGTCHRLGIEIVAPFAHTPESYENFLKERERFLLEKKKESEALKHAKLMRI